MNASDYFEQKILYLLKGQPMPAVSAYVGLFQTTPSDSGGGTPVSYAGYARQRITFTTPAATGTDKDVAIKNTGDINFPVVNQSSGTVNGIGVYDAQTNGNLLIWGNLSSPLSLEPGVTPVFKSGSIQFTMKGSISPSYKINILKTLNGTVLNGISPYAGFCLNDPATTGREVSVEGYTRLGLVFGGSITQLSNGYSVLSNTNEVTTTSSGLVVPWGNINYLGIYASASGALFSSIPLGHTYTITAGSVVGFHSGAVSVSIN